MTDLALILFGALLVNNFVLAQFLGLCPFMGITRGVDTALATGIATNATNRWLHESLARWHWAYWWRSRILEVSSNT